MNDNEAWMKIGFHYVFCPDRLEERKAFAAGWQYREDHGPCPPVVWSGDTPYAKALDLYQNDQNCRVAWEIGWAARNGNYGEWRPGDEP